MAIVLSPFAAAVERHRRIQLALIAYAGLYAIYWFFVATHQTRFLMPAILVALVMSAIAVARFPWLLVPFETRTSATCLRHGDQGTSPRQSGSRGRTRPRRTRRGRGAPAEGLSADILGGQLQAVPDRYRSSRVGTTIALSEARGRVSKERVIPSLRSGRHRVR